MIVGGSGNCGSNCVISRYYTISKDYPCYYQIKISLKFYPIGTWTGEEYKLSLDGTNIITKTASSELLSGDLQEFTQLFQNKKGFSITISNTLVNPDNTIVSLGISDVKITVFTCDSICKTCEGTATACTSCYPYGDLNDGCKCVPGFYATKISNCVLEPCTVCNPCHSACITCDRATRCIDYKPYLYYEGGITSDFNWIYNFFSTQDISAIAQPDPKNNWNFGADPLKYETKTCNSLNYLANKGPDVKFSLSLQLPLTPFFDVAVEFKLTRFCYWNGESFIVSTNNDVVIFDMAFYQTRAPIQCTPYSVDETYTVRKRFAKSDRNLILNMYTTPGSTVKWGISDLKVDVMRCFYACKTCSEDVYTNSNCITCYEDAELNSDGYCNCKEGFYYEEDRDNCILQPCTVCRMCHPTCKTCYGPNDNFCESCFDNFVLQDVSTCLPQKDNFIVIVFAMLKEVSPFKASDLSQFIIYDSSNNVVIPVIKKINTNGDPYQDVLSVFGSGNYFKSEIFDFDLYSPHFELVVEIAVFRIGVWNDKKIKLFCDNVEVFTHTFIEGKNNYQTDENPPNVADMFLIRKRVVHNTNTLTIKLATDLIATDTTLGFGIRDFQINLILCHKSCKKCEHYFDQCIECYGDATLDNINHKCVCKSNYYFYTSSVNEVAHPGYHRAICQQCQYGCLTCTEGFDGSPSKCTACINNIDYTFNDGVCTYSKTNEMVFVEELTEDFSASVQVLWNNLIPNFDFTAICLYIPVLGGNKVIPAGYTKPILTRNLDFTNKPPFYQLIYNLGVIFFDNLGVEFISIELNNGSPLIEYVSKGAIFMCGEENKPDIMVQLAGDYFFDNSLTLKFLIKANSDSVSFGLVGFKIIARRCHSSCSTCNGPNSNQCLTCYPFSTYLNGVCTCDSGFYFSEIASCIEFPCSSCKLCHSSCKTCEGPADNQCIDCYGSDLIENKKCTNNFANGTVRAYQILQDFTNDFFDGSTTLLVWTVTQVSAATKYLECNKYFNIYGGINIFIHDAKLVYANPSLQDHYAMKINFRIIKFYQTTKLENIYLKIDSENEVLLDLTSGFIRETNDFCIPRSLTINQNKVILKYFEFEIEHRNIGLQIAIYSKLDSGAVSESWGVRDFQVKTYKCDIACLKCYGPLANECLGCVVGKHLLGSICVDKCPIIHFPEQDNSIPTSICKVCSPTCKACTTLGTCTECYEDATLSVNAPLGVCTCNDGFYAKTDTANCNVIPCTVCQMCHPLCKTCTGPTANHCGSCFTNYLLTGTSCVEQKQFISLETGIYFQDTVINKNDISDWNFLTAPIYKTCETKEIVSTFAFDNKFTRTFSFPTYTAHYEIILEFTFYRFDIWDDKQFRIFVDDINVHSHTFLNGKNPLLTSDNIIADKYFVKKRIAHNSQTLKVLIDTTLTALNTNSGWGIRDFKVTLVFCLPTCKKCINYNECIDCFYNAVVNTKVCICEDGYFMNNFPPESSENQRSICLMCHESCKKCSGANSNNCLECYPGGTFNSGTGVCDNSAANNLLVSSELTTDFSSNVLDSWNIKDHSLNYIYTCDTETIFGGKHSVSPKPSIFKTFDLITFPPHYAIIYSLNFFSIDDFGTEKITISIDDVPLLIQSISQGPFKKCGDVSQYESKLPFTSNVPHNSFSLKFLISASSDSVSWGFRDFILKLKKCHNSCYTCSGPNSNECLTCYPFAKFFEGTCTCMDGFYFTQTEPCNEYPCSVCKLCDISCKTCEGPGNNLCASCYSTEILESKVCKTKFLNGTEISLSYQKDFNDYLFNENFLNIVWTVSNVVAINKYLECVHWFKLFGGREIFKGDAKIIPTLIDIEPNYAVKISFGLYKFYKTTKDENIFIKVDNLNEVNIDLTLNSLTTDSFCVPRSSTQSQFKVIYKYVIYEIPHQIKTLNVQIYSKLNNNAVDESWGIRDFQVQIYKCHSTCTTCFGPNSNECLTCTSKNGLYLSNNYCVTICDSGYFANDITSQCQKCDISCKECDGASNSNCLICFSDKSLYEKTCITPCLRIFFSEYDAILGTSVCNICSPSCKACTTLGTCTECYEDATLSISAPLGVCTCNDGFYVETDTANCKVIPCTVCQMCHPLCKTCTGPAANQCGSCFKNYLLTGTSCVEQKQFISFETGIYFQDTIINKNDISDWNVLTAPIYKTCETKEIVSTFVFDNKFTRTFSFPTYTAHYEIILEFTFYRFGIWDDKQFRIFVDDINVHSHTFLNGKNPLLSSDNIIADKYFVKKRIAHNSQTLKVLIDTTLTALNTNSGWGIRDFKVTLVFCLPTCKKCINYNECIDCFYNATVVSKSCICDEGFYMKHYVSDLAQAQQSKCILCHDSCKTCNGGNYDNCLTCNSESTIINGVCVNILSNELLVVSDLISDFSKSIQKSWNIDESIDYTYLCDKTLILGGNQPVKQNLLKTIDLTKVPSHYSIIFNLTLYTIDNFGLESLSILIDNSPALIQYISQNSIKKCGENVIPITGTIIHSALTLKFEVKASSTLISWGIRDFYLKIKKCHNSCYSCFGPEANQCIQCYPFAVKVGGLCKCMDGFFYSETINCKIHPCSYCDFCDSSCKTCLNEKTKCSSCNTDDQLTDNKCIKKFTNGTTRYLDTYTDFVDNFFSPPKNTFVWKIGKISIKKKYTILQTLEDITTFTGDTEISTSINDLPLHYALKITFRLFKFYKSTQFEEIFLKVSDKEEINLDILNEQEKKTNSFAVERNPLQTETKSILKFVEIELPHQSSTIDVSIYCIKDDFSKDETWTLRDLKLTFFKCDPSCNTCSGPLQTNCLTCDQSKSLYFYNNKCVLQCEDGYFMNDDSGICQNCEPSCKKCNSALATDCSGCPLNTFLYNNSCVIKCPSGYYPEYELKSASFNCYICHSSCMECSGPEKSQCLSCDSEKSVYFNDGFCNPCNELCQVCTNGINSECSFCKNNSYLYDSKCYSTCPKYTFPSVIDNVCDNCHYSCKSCNGSNANECLSCESDHFLNLNNTCLSKCGDGSYLLKENICAACDALCKECSPKKITECISCYYGFNLFNNSLCLKSEEINIELLESDNNPLVIVFSLNKEWREFSDQISNYIKITIQDITNDKYTYIAKTANEYPKSIEIHFNYLTNITLKTMIIEFNEPKDLEILYPFTVKSINFTIPLKNFTICDDHYYYDNETLMCELKPSSDPIQISLQETSKPTQFILLITNGERKFHKIIAQVSDFEIEGVSKDKFKYEVSLPNERIGLVYVEFDFKTPIIGRPKIKSIINIPKSFLVNINNEVVISKEYASISDSYELSQSDKEIVQDAKSISETGGAVTAASIITSLLIIPSFGPLKVLMLVNLLSFVKFLDVNYPPNIQQLFETKEYSLPLLLFNFNNNSGIFIETKEISDQNYQSDIKYNNDVFKKYGINLYFISNFGDNIIQFVIVFCIAIMFYYFKKKHTITHKYLKLAFDLVHGFLVWGWILSFFICNFRNITFFIIRSWTFSKFNSWYSKLDLFCSITFFLSCFFLLVHVFFVNYNIKKIIKEKKNKERRKTITNEDNAKNDYKQDMSPLTKLISKSENDEKTTTYLKKNNASESKKQSEKKIPVSDVEFSEKDIDEKIEITVIKNIEMKNDIKLSEKDIDEKIGITVIENIEMKNENFSSASKEKNNENKEKDVKDIENIKPEIKETKEIDVKVKKPIIKQMTQNLFISIYEYDNSEEYQKKYSFLSKDYKTENLVTMNFILIELGKFFLYSLIIVAIFKLPFLQISLIVAINIYFFTVLAIYRPYKAKLKFFFGFIQEIVVTFALICICVISFKDFIGDNEPSSRVLLGTYFLQANSTLVIVSIIGMATIGIHKGIRSIVKFMKAQKQKKKEIKK